jgi:MoxR-like ATPase
MKLSLGYPGRKDEVKMLTSQRLEHPISQVEARLDSERVIELQRHVREVFVDPTLDAYVVSLTGATRSDSRLTIGASPRGSISLIRTSQALALLTGRDYVLPEDIKAVAPYVLVHRLVASPEARARQMTEADIITSLLAEAPAPPVQRVMPA